jgi:hypothetical protein
VSRVTAVRTGKLQARKAILEVIPEILESVTEALLTGAIVELHPLGEVVGFLGSGVQDSLRLEDTIFPKKDNIEFGGGQLTSL